MDVKRLKEIAAQGTILPDRTCERCGSTGPEKSFHKAGQYGYINVCRKCVAKKRTENREYSIVKTQDVVVLGPRQVIVDFSDITDGQWERLTTDARSQYRTLENEIKFRALNCRPTPVPDD